MIKSPAMTGMHGISEPVLGIETSCDDTAAAIVAGGKVLSSVVARQEEHLPFDGVVPELASRAHVRLIGPVVKKTLADAGLDWGDLAGIGATHAPGLIGSLLVGLTFAKAAAAARGLPFVGVNHLEAHIVSPLISNPEIEPPFVALLASGGHTEIVHARAWHDYHIMGSTRDDAAGEAFDKVAVLLGEGYPGGPVVDRLAGHGDPKTIPFPRAWLGKDSLELSFSGLKTAVRNEVQRRGGTEAISDQEKADIAAGFQESVVEVLCSKTFHAARTAGVQTVILAGGVAANRVLRSTFDRAADDAGMTLAVPELRWCGDNGAMVALSASMHLALGETSSLDLPAVAALAATDFSG